MAYWSAKMEAVVRVRNKRPKAGIKYQRWWWEASSKLRRRTNVFIESRVILVFFGARMKFTPFWLCSRYVLTYQDLLYSIRKEAC